MADRFWAKVEKTDRCWLWTGAKMPNGYGSIRDGNGRVAGAHRVAYELQVGPIPAGMHLDHLCRNRACVRGDHLEAVPQAVNTRRGDSPWAQRARQTHCIRGHEYTDANTIHKSMNRRECRTCENQRQRAKYHRAA